VPVAVLHGDDDQVVPYADSAPLSAKLLKNGTLKTYPGYPHGMATTHADVINKDILAFIRGEDFGADRQEEERLIVEPIPAPVE
jgi:non-heme chloroperoxidase